MGFVEDLKQQYKNGGYAQKLIFWNIGVFILMFIIEKVSPSIFSVLFDNVAVSSFSIMQSWKVWTYFTYSFLHADIWHLLMNMIVLHFVSTLFATYFSQKQFLTIYLLGAFFGAVFFIALSSVFATGSVLVGASAAIMAPMIGLAYYAPHMEIRLALVGRVKMWHIAAFIIVLNIFQFSSSNVGGLIAHLGGAFIGVVYVMCLRRGTDLSSIFDGIVNLFRKRKGSSFKKVYVNKEKKVTKTSHLNDDELSNQKKIDIILDKISKSGYESLSKEEKEFLFKVGKK